MMILRYHHVGIPTNRPLPREDYSEECKMGASGHFESPYGVEWMTFDPDCPLPELVKTVDPCLTNAILIACVRLGCACRRRSRRTSIPAEEQGETA